MRRYRLRERAAADLADIWRYTAQRWSVAQADKYYREIVAALEGLGADLACGKSCDDVRPGYFRFGVGAHVVFYIASADGADVIRILHARRDFRRHLPAV